MYWEDFLKQNPDINIEDLGKPAEFKPPVKPKRTTPKGPGPVDKGWAAYQNWRQEPDLEKKFGSLGKTIPAYTQTQDALKWAWNPNPDRVQQPSTQQEQRGKTTKYRQLGKARSIWQGLSEDQKIQALGSGNVQQPNPNTPNPGNTKQVETSNNNNLKVYNVWNRDNPIVSGSVADAQGSVADTQGWTGWEKVWNKMSEDQEKGGGGGSGGNNDGKKDDDKKNTDRKDKLNELSEKFETALDLTKAIWGDQTKERAHFVKMSEIDENPFSGYVA